MMITGTHFNYYFICHRKLWLFANGIQMEQTSELVELGKLIHETAYPQRADKYREIEIEGIKIDFFDTKNNIVHEIKKSGAREEAHEWQLKYYLYILEKHGIQASGILEYPKLRKTEEVFLTEPDREYIAQVVTAIEQITGSETAPPCLKQSHCRNCSYYEFCWSGEENVYD